ncbi:Serine/threonine-protein kinase ATG1c [Euphorbia peplus]|nr:Serine/threonine-protein kinase ATG1c [Euphorbia peplus]
MAHAPGRGRIVGDYLVGRQIGSGSFSVVWHARHRIHGTEVAIKEIATGRLNKKLQESLMSEIYILKRINHPNIICLHDIIEVPGRINIVLEYCRGGDLSMYIQRHGRVPEATAKHFMQQLAAGLQVLRDNNLIHRDLKPQNLLLSTNDGNAVLKIADFGFARSLQPRGLAETLCGSPLYMAPEIMQLQKYDAKADLWSVGAILFQLVTGKTPFTGNNQIQLLQNIVKSTELEFPLDSKDLSADCKDLCRKLLRRNPVERLTFDEFFNHPFLANRKMEEELRDTMFSKSVDSYRLSDNNSARNSEENSQEDCLPFFLDDDSSGPESSPSFSNRRSRMKSTYGFSLDTQVDGKEAKSNVLNNMDFSPRYTSSRHNLENTNFKPNISKFPDENLHEGRKPLSQRSMPVRSRVVDSLESIDQDYVIVSGPPLEVSSSLSTSKPSHIPYMSSSPPRASANVNTAPVRITGNTNTNICHIGSSESRSSAPGTSQESMDAGYVLEHPSTHCVLTRIKSLQQCASAISDLVHEKVEAARQLEAFSIQLVILAIWKQALHICHTQAASAIEGSPSKDTRLRRSNSKKHGTSDTEDCNDAVPADISSQIEREFLREVEHAEELAKAVDPGNVEMPDAMETIFQSALALGRHGGVEELMGETESASFLYSKAVRLLVFLLVEASSLILNPPFSLTNSDRYRLRSYIDILNNRQANSRSQRMALLKCEEQQCPP